MRDRFLLRADVEGYTYRDILEVRPGRVRLLRPSKELRRALRVGMIAIVLFWLVIEPFVYWGVSPLFAQFKLPDVLSVTFASIVFLVGVVASTLLWDHLILPILADNTPNATDVKVLGMMSYWTFQEVRASGPQGELRITVQGSQKRVSRALRFGGSLPAAGA